MTGLTTIEARQAAWVRPGTELIAVGTRSYNLTEGKVYRAVNGAEEGIFSNRPFVTVVDDEGKEAVAHLSRFAFKEAVQP